MGVCSRQIAMSDISEDVKAYESMQHDLEASHKGMWVLIRDRALIGIFSSFEDAADAATQRFGRGPFLIREVGAEPTTLPISVMFAWNAQR